MVHAPDRPPEGAPPVRINLYSDTQTRPTAAMRQAMARAPVGDEQSGDDPTVNALCDRVAALLGREAALFLPSGTMCNVIATLVHARPGDEMLAHATAHVLASEGGAHAALGGVQILGLPGPRGMFGAGAVRAALRPRTRNDPPQTLLSVEQTANIGGGAVWPRAELAAVAAVAREAGMATHMDGARLLNATVAAGVAPHLMAEGWDTVWLDFTKGLGAPIGAVLAGSAGFVGAAWRWKQRLGGAMRQAGIAAAGCLHALDHHVARLAEDHANAAALAAALAAIPGVAVEAPETNLVYFDPAGAGVAPDAVAAALRARGILVSRLGGRLRACTHLDVTAAMAAEAAAAVRDVLATGRAPPPARS